MKKSFYFALALTAGLFASCSSDDISQAPGLSGQENYGNAEKTPIVINVSTPGVTRGTGTVGSTTGPNNKWAGQTFNLFMFKHGSFIPARIARTEGDPETDIFNNAELSTPTAGATSNAAVYTLNNEITASYYPDGQFDFWAYRIDDAWIDDAGVAGWDTANNPDETKKQVIGVATETAATAASYTWEAYDGQEAATLNGTENPTTTTVGTVGAIYENTTTLAKFACTAVTPAGEAGWNDPATTTAVAIPFKINGSQDIMIGTAKAPKGWTKTTADGSFTPDEDYYAKGTDKVPESKIFSAYAARRAFNPSLAFTHQLTRLTFEVEAATRDVSEAASCKLSPVPANWTPGFTITGITVRSKSKGQLVAAYKGAAPASYIDWTKDETGANSTELWNNPSSLALLNLMSREKAVDEKAKIAFIEVSKNETGNIDIVTTADTYKNINDETEYLTITTAVSQTLNDYVTAGLVYKTKETDPTTGQASGLKLTTTNWNQEAGEKVYILVVNSGTHGTPAVTYDKCTYSATAENANAGLVALENVKPGWKNLVKKYTNITATASLAQKTAAINVTTEPTGVPAAEDALGKLLKWVDGATTNYYIVEVDNSDPANEGSSVATSVGEALLVAPADENGYEVTIHYTRSKINSETDIQNLPDKKTIIVTRKANVGGGNTDFEIGSTYNIKIKLFGDAEAQFEVDDPTPWNKGTGTEDSYSAE